MGCGLKNTLDCYGVPVPDDNGGKRFQFLAQYCDQYTFYELVIDDHDLDGDWR
jgi:hypothetical protein